MNLLQALVLGMVEGATEFLPISSTFHLLMVEQLLHVPSTEFAKFFAVFIQAFAILPVIFLFGREWQKKPGELLKVGAAFIPTAVVGFLMHKVIKEIFFGSNVLMLVSFVVVGVLFLVTELLVQRGKIKLHRSLSQLSFSEAILIGVVQAFAVVPGVSRAGAVIVGMMFLGFKRDEAAKFSFTLAVPTLLAAATLDLLKVDKSILLDSQQYLLPLVIGCLSAMGSALIVIKWFIQFLRQNSLRPFAWYRFGAAAVFAILLK